jgi:hypothetical protein
VSLKRGVRLGVSVGTAVGLDVDVRVAVWFGVGGGGVGDAVLVGGGVALGLGDRVGVALHAVRSASATRSH